MDRDVFRPNESTEHEIRDLAQLGLHGRPHAGLVIVVRVIVLDVYIDVDVGLHVLAHLRRRLIVDALAGEGQRTGKAKVAVDIVGDLGLYLRRFFV